ELHELRRHLACEVLRAGRELDHHVVNGAELVKRCVRHRAVPSSARCWMATATRRCSWSLIKWSCSLLPARWDGGVAGDSGAGVVSRSRNATRRSAASNHPIRVTARAPWTGRVAVPRRPGRRSARPRDAQGEPGCDRGAEEQRERCEVAEEEHAGEDEEYV